MSRTMADAFNDFYDLGVKPLAESISTLSGGTGSIDLTNYATKDDLSSEISLCRSEYSTIGTVDTSTFVSLSDHATLEAKVNLINMDELEPLIKEAKMTFDKAEAIVWAKNGSNLKVKSKVAKFGSSLYCDGTSWLYNSEPIELGGQDFTVDFWAYPTSTANDHRRVVDFQRSGNTFTDGFMIQVHNGGFWTQGVIPEISITPAEVESVLNQWTHLAFVYQHDITTFKVFFNGVCTYSNDSVTFDRSRPFTNAFIGGSVYTNSTKFIGYLDEFRISDGVARWTSDFTPPTSEYSLDSYTISLLHW